MRIGIFLLGGCLGFAWATLTFNPRAAAHARQLAMKAWDDLTTDPKFYELRPADMDKVARAQTPLA